MPRARKYLVELIERGVRLALKSGRPIAHVAADLGCTRKRCGRMFAGLKPMPGIVKTC
jgi:hypothetical protein